VEITKAILIEASSLRDRNNISYWDSLIIGCALAEDASVLYSEDIHTGLIVEKQLQIINPFAK
jgi:predicted nucleic acid-binding protein